MRLLDNEASRDYMAQLVVNAVMKMRRVTVSRTQAQINQDRDFAMLDAIIEHGAMTKREMCQHVTETDVVVRDTIGRLVKCGWLDSYRGAGTGTGNVYYATKAGRRAAVSPIAV